jgi:hypothetical protein
MRFTWHIVIATVVPDKGSDPSHRDHVEHVNSVA